MLKVNEIKLGNWVLKNNGNQYVPHQIEPVDLMLLEESLKQNVLERNYKPIPLTQLLVEKMLGKDLSSQITEHTKIYNFHFGHFQLLIHKLDGSFVLARHDTSQVPIFYLHELQNIYNALTGNQLTKNIEITQDLLTS